MKTSLSVPIKELAKDFFHAKSFDLLEKTLKGIDEIYIENPENGKFKSLDIKTKNGKIDKVDISFEDGNSFSYKRNKREIQDALVFINKGEE